MGKIEENNKNLKLNVSDFIPDEVYNDIAEDTRSSLSKEDKRLSKSLSTGTKLNRPSSDKDFILWEDGSFWSDLTGTRGLPLARCTMVLGQSNSGKSSLAAQYMAYAQNQGCFVILWDSEQKFAADRFRDHIKGNPDRIFVVDTNSILDAAKGISLFVKAIKKKKPDARILIVIDSIGAAVNSAEGPDAEDMSLQPGRSAKEVSYLLKLLMGLINHYQNKETGEHSISILCINQVYKKIGFMAVGYQARGGTMLEYLSSIIIMLSRKKDLTKVRGGKKIKYGILSKAQVMKNHMFSGVDCLAEIDIVVDASGVRLAEEVRKKDVEVQWDEPNLEDE